VQQARNVRRDLQDAGLIHASRRSRIVVAEQVASAIRSEEAPITSVWTSLSNTTRSRIRDR
jgi:hypothetical protein